MLEVRDFPRAPKDVRDTEDRAAERAALFLKSRLKRLSDEKASEIEKKLTKWYRAWHKQTDKQRSRLVRYADLLEGVVEDSNVPFEGASNITLHYAAGMARTFRANFNKTAYQDEDIFYAMPSPKLQKKVPPEKLAALDEGFNFSFSRACNGLRTLKEGTIPCVRDGTLVVSGYWHREVRRCFDQRTYRSLEAFQKDYPDADAAGVTQEVYDEILDFFVAHVPTAPEPNPAPDAAPDPAAGAPSPEPQDQPELVVGFEYDHVYKNEPEYRVGPWAKFVRYPLSVRALGECQLYGYEVREDRETVKLKAKRGEYYERGAKKALDGKAADDNDPWDKALGFVEGITQPTEPDEKSVRKVEGCCVMDLDGDGIPEKYQVQFDPKSEALLSLVPHRLRRGVDSAVPFVMVKRENRLDGVSLIGDCEDLFNQIDINARHRNNVRLLTTSPVFLANKAYKEQIDLGRAENVIRPGVTYWVEDPTKAIQQLELHDLSTNADGMDELNLYKTHVELVFGPTQAQSGMQTPNDPRAPARKTQMLLMQSGGRLDDYLDQFMESGPALAELHAALLFQYADGPEVSYLKGAKLISFPIELLADPDLIWGMKRRSVQLTPEFAMARLGALMNLYTNLRPLLATGDPIATALWNRSVLASGEPQADKFLISGENLEKVQQSLMAASQMNPASPENKAKAKGLETMHKEIAKEGVKRLTGQQAPAGQNGSSGVK